MEVPFVQLPGLWVQLLRALVVLGSSLLCDECLFHGVIPR